MKKYILLFLSVVYSLSLYAQRGRDTVNFYVFGIRLIMDFSSFGQYYVFYRPRKTDVLEYANSLSQRDFILQAMGRQSSPANLKKENFFLKYGVCPEIYSLPKKRRSSYCYEKVRDILSNLWRLRYSEYPYLIKDPTFNPKGWAGKEYRPSYAQMSILHREFNMDTLSYLIVGENVFLLIRALGDKSWVEAYKNAAQQGH